MPPTEPVLKLIPQAKTLGFAEDSVLVQNVLALVGGSSSAG
jgi:hypothetical protein